MAARDRIPVFPSRANQVIIKQRAQAAARGANLLKRKRDAIDLKLRELKHDMSDRKDIADEMMRAAIFSMAKANFFSTDFNAMLFENSEQAEAFVVKSSQKIVGITLPHLELIIRSERAYPLTGLARGGSQVATVRESFQEALKNIIAYASLDYAVNVLTIASRQNNMRVNALEHIVVPRLQNTSNYIRDELEEFEREDFYRLKRSRAKQVEAKLAFTEMIKTKNMTDEQKELYKKSSVVAHPVADKHFDIEEFESRKSGNQRGPLALALSSVVREAEADDSTETEREKRKKKRSKSRARSISTPSVVLPEKPLWQKPLPRAALTAVPSLALMASKIVLTLPVDKRTMRTQTADASLLASKHGKFTEPFVAENDVNIQTDAYNKSTEQSNQTDFDNECETQTDFDN